MSKLRQRDDSSGYMSCIEAVGIEGLSEDEADAKYKETAERLLLDEQVESILKPEAEDE